MGYKRAGYMVLGNCEIDPKIAEVYKRNLHPKYSYVMDIRDFNKLETLPDELYNLDVLDGSPPCSTFSMAGDREKAWGVEKQFAEGQKYQRLDDLFFVFLDTVEKLQPKAFVAENVTGLLNGNAKGYVNEIVKRSREIGYSVQLFKLNAAFMGVPQRRERVFFIGNRMGWPKLRVAFNEGPVAFGDVRSIDGGQPLPPSARRLHDLRKNETCLAETRERVDGKRSHFNFMACEDDMPAYTVVASNKVYRACDATFFTETDNRNVSTFPQDYVFGRMDAAFICGMSVPPSMMANIAYEIKEQWLNGKE